MQYMLMYGVVAQPAACCQSGGGMLTRPPATRTSWVSARCLAAKASPALRISEAKLLETRKLQKRIKRKKENWHALKCEVN